VAEIAKQFGIATHMDGARLMNAVVKSGIPATEWTEGYDSCWIDFSKGLGAPIGAVLAGSRDFIGRAWRVKQRIGGALRQSGIVTAMCHYALDHNVDRLADDHALAASIADRIARLPGIRRVLPVQTNIIIFDLQPGALAAPELADRLRADGVLVGAFGADRIRAVTHLGVNPESGDALCAGLARHLSGA